MANINIVKGEIGNALTSVAPNHIIGVAQDIFDEELQMYQSEINSGLGDGAFDVSVKYPTSGVDGGNTYTLEGALDVLNANLAGRKKKGGMSIKFIKQDVTVSYNVVNGTSQGASLDAITVNNQFTLANGSAYSANDILTAIEDTTDKAAVETAINGLSNNGDSTVIQYYLDGTNYATWTITKNVNTKNKYVQYRLMSPTWSTNTANWQGVDDEPTAGSDNMVKSGGVASGLNKIGDTLNRCYLLYGLELYNTITSVGVTSHGAIFSSTGKIATNHPEYNIVEVANNGTGNAILYVYPNEKLNARLPDSFCNIAIYSTSDNSLLQTYRAHARPIIAVRCGTYVRISSPVLTGAKTSYYCKNPEPYSVFRYTKSVGVVSNAVLRDAIKATVVKDNILLNPDGIEIEVNGYCVFTIHNPETSANDGFYVQLSGLNGLIDYPTLLQYSESDDSLVQEYRELSGYDIVYVPNGYYVKVSAKSGESCYYSSNVDNVNQCVDNVNQWHNIVLVDTKSIEKGYVITPSQTYDKSYIKYSNGTIVSFAGIVTEYSLSNIGDTVIADCYTYGKDMISYVFLDSNGNVLKKGERGSNGVTTHYEDLVLKVPIMASILRLNGLSNAAPQLYSYGTSYKKVATKQYVDQELDGKVSSLWKDKKIVWYGTSIPAQGYPINCGIYLKANVVNEAKGSSMARIGKSSAEPNNPIGDEFGVTGVAWQNVFYSLTLKQSEKKYIFDNWTKARRVANLKARGTYDAQNDTYTIDGVVYTTAQIEAVSGYADIIGGSFYGEETDETEITTPKHKPTDIMADNYTNYRKTVYRCSYDTSTNIEPGFGTIEGKIEKYLNEEDFPDLFVIDHGLNDRLGESAELLNTIPNTYNDRHYFLGAMNFIIDYILQYNPRARFLIISHYENGLSSTKALNGAQDKLAEYWDIPICRIFEKFQMNMQRMIRTNAYWDANGVWQSSGYTGENSGNNWTGSHIEGTPAHTDEVMYDKEGNIMYDDNGNILYTHLMSMLWVYQRDGLHPGTSDTKDFYGKSIAAWMIGNIVPFA